VFKNGDEFSLQFKVGNKEKAKNIRFLDILKIKFESWWCEVYYLNGSVEKYYHLNGYEYFFNKRRKFFHPNNFEALIKAADINGIHCSIKDDN